MPLVKSRSKKAFEQNIRTLAREGKDMKQSLAIAYSIRSPRKKKGKK